MNFFEAIKSCFVRYTDFSSRSIRSEYWNFGLFIIIVGFIVDYIDALNAGIPWLDYEKWYGPLGIIWLLLTIVPSFAVGVRRLHDINKSGWWVLLAFTIIGLIPLIYWACLKGDEGDNRFGSNPLKY